jgi:two-component system chemotaxis response regulator CheB
MTPFILYHVGTKSVSESQWLFVRFFYVFIDHTSSILQEMRRRRMRKNPAIKRIVVVGASAGGIQAICTLLSGLPATFPFPIFVVIHISRTQEELPSVLNRCGLLRAVHPRQDEPIRPGRIYVAPPNQHLIIENGRIELSHGPRENRFRPAVDPLFRSAARAYRERVIGIILSGALDDGVAGLFAVKARGGVAIAQEPAEAIAPSMPAIARDSVEVDHCLPVTRIASLLIKLSQEDKPMAAKNKRRTARRATPLTVSEDALCGANGVPVPLACPDCNGPLFEIKEGKLVQFHCLVGHAFSPISLNAAHADALERAIWVAIRTFRERLNIQRLLKAKQKNANLPLLGQDADAIEQDIELLKQIQARI